MILLLDNYDSFTYNIAQYAEGLGAEVKVLRNDEMDVAGARALNPKAILISPGPCTPDKAGISEEIVRAFANDVPIFGVCLGMQAIAEVFGARIVPAKRIMHGKESQITHRGVGVLSGIPSPFGGIRYHSLAVERESLPGELEITAESEDGEIMAIKHKTLAIEGVQFHPESILTEHGQRIIENWLRAVLGD